MAQKKEIETIYPQNPQEWREWLERNHQEQDAVWVIFYKKESGQPTLSWSESVDEALCFGWIDSLKKSWTKKNPFSFSASGSLKVLGQKSTKKK